ncbi:MAG: MtrB/PioB family outer membrane beta-barrel protein [Usitatibacter sp.]
MKRTTLPLLIAGLFGAGSSFADDTPAPMPWITQGEVSVGAIGTNTSGKDPSKLQEYQDLRNGGLSEVLVRGRNSQDWLDFYGENFGRDDLFVTLRGGRYDTFKYGISTNWLPHDFAENALTPFQGSGTALLNATFPSPDPSTWNKINLGYERKDTKAFFEWHSVNPWYTRVDGQQITFDGTRPGSGALGTSPGNGFMDLAIPISYTTNTASAEVGYSSYSSHFAVNYTYSKFDNGNTQLQWTNPFFGGVDTTYLASDNTYQRIAANGVLRGLPGSSTFAARYTWAKTTNETGVPQTALGSGGVYSATMPSANTYSGEYVDQTLSLSLNSSPMKNVDTKVFYNFHKLANNSTPIVFAEGTAVDCGGPCTSTLYDYTKNNFGLEGIWRMQRGSRLSGGWDYLDTDQTRVDFDHVRDNKLWVEYKNTSLDELSLRVKYQYLQRRSDFLLGDSGTGPTDPNYINRFVARFDNSDMNRNYLKLIGDWTPAELVDVSLEATLSKNDYPNTVLGRTRDTRHELFGTVSWGDFSSFRVVLMADYEWVKYDSYHRNISDSAAGGAFDPSAAPTSSNYNWSSKDTDDNWLLGIGVDWQAAEKLLVKLSAQYFKSDGSSNVDSQNNFGNPLPITAYDDWKQAAVNLKGIYTLDKRWSLTAGYAYNKIEYSDIAYNGYQYTVPFPAVTTNTAQSYGNGYRAFPNSNVNTVYFLATMHF